MFDLSRYTERLLIRREDNEDDGGGGGSAPSSFPFFSINTISGESTKVITSIFKIVRYKDAYIVTNLSNTTIEYYITTYSCTEEVDIVVLSGLLEEGKIITINLPYDGNFRFSILSGISIGQSVCISHYPKLIKKIVRGTKAIVCNNCDNIPCKGCKSKEEKQCLIAQDTINSMIVLNTFLSPLVSGGCIDVTIVNRFVDAAISNFKCRIQRDICNANLITSVTGEANPTNMWSKYFIAFYYLGFFYREADLASDAEELAYIKDKYEYSKIKNCISDLGICLDTLKDLFEGLEVVIKEDNNIAPVVTDKRKSLLPDLSGPTPVYNYQFTVADFINGFYDANGDNPSELWITSIPNGVTLYKNNVEVSNSTLIIPYNQANQLRIVIPSNAGNTFAPILTYKVSDDNSNPLFSNQGKISFNLVVTGNLPPSCVETIINTIKVGQTITLTAAMFEGAFTDPEGDDIEYVKIATSSYEGSITIKLNGVPITSNQLIAFSDIEAGLLKATCLGTAVVGSSFSFNYSMSDTGSHLFTNTCSNNDTSIIAKLRFNITAAIKDVEVSIEAEESYPANTTGISLSGVTNLLDEEIASIIWEYISVLPDEDLYIESPTSLDTNITGLTNGTNYTFKLTVVSNLGQVGTTTVSFNVDNAVVIIVEAGETTINYNSYSEIPQTFKIAVPEYITAYTHSTGLAAMEVKITGLPTTGGLSINNVPVEIGDTFTIESLLLDDTALVFDTKAASEEISGNYEDSFSFKVLDINGVESNEVTQLIHVFDIDGIFDDEFDDEFE
jgi:hypothetical protein